MKIINWTRQLCIFPLLIIWVLTFLVGCSFQSERRIERQSEKVYKVILPLVVKTDSDLVEINNIGQGLSNNEFKYIKEKMPQVQQKTWENLVRSNENVVPLQKSLLEKKDYRFVSWDDLPKSGDIVLNYEANEKIYPGASGIIGISRIGFNNTMTQSLILVDSSSIMNPLWGSGYLILCEKIFGLWVVKQKYQLYFH